MLNLNNAKPNAQQAKYLRQHIQTKTLDSLLYLISRCELASHCDFFDAKNALKKLRTKRANGLLYAIHEQLLLSMKANNADKVTEILTQCDFTKCTYHGLLVRPLNGDAFNPVENKLIYDTAKASHDNLYAKQYDCCKPSDEAFKRSQEAVDKALDHIKILCPDYYEEFNQLITDIVICESNLINAGTCFNTFGFLYIKQLDGNETWVKYYEHLIHEAGHHYLYTVLAHDRLITPESNNQLHSSPLRKEKRPLNGIYQAMFVLTRTIDVFARMKKHPDYVAWLPYIRTYYNNAKNSASFEQKFFDTYTVLESYAELTPIGKQLLKNCKTLVETTL